jgi:hypothetical protein
LNAYNKNKELFSLAGKQDLFKLYTQLKNNFIRVYFLIDIHYLSYNFNKEDIPVLLEWKQMETNGENGEWSYWSSEAIHWIEYIIFIIERYGK